jgi:site-specific recombinase XerD
MKHPIPVFDDLNHIDQCDIQKVVHDQRYINDFKHALDFLKAYNGSLGTFLSYRRDVERLLHWCMLIAHKTLNELRRQDIEDFIHFCQKPPKIWIGVHKVTRFIEEDGLRLPNPKWRPFVVTISKSAHKLGEKPNPKDFELSPSAVKDMFAILGSFYNYLLQDEYVYMNPVALIRQKSKFIRKTQDVKKIRRLSERQWNYVIQTAKQMADVRPEMHERTLFIMSILYLMYLRISELVASKRWTPLMHHFFKDSDENWWFTTVGKGNKQRQIAVSDAMLESLKRWRTYLGLSPLPSLADQSSLLPKVRGLGPMGHATHVRKIVQSCFDQAMNQLKLDGHIEEAYSLGEATVHWLRHTGISDDVKHRPREHVRDDAGHGSGAITDRYIDVNLKDRHKSAKNKQLQEGAIYNKL